MSDNIDLKLTVSNKTTFEVPSENHIIDIIKQVLANKNIGGDIEIDIIFVSKDDIKALNNKYRHIDNPTDVLSFPITDKPKDIDAPILLGDIIVCPEIVTQNAQQYQSTYELETDKMLKHCLLHLIGIHHN